MTNAAALQSAQRLVGIFRHGGQNRGMLVQEHLEPGPHVLQFYLVTLRIGFRTELLNRIFDVIYYGFHNQVKLLDPVHD